MRDEVDLEIGLSWDRGDDKVRAFLRLDMPGTAMDEWRQAGEPLDLDFDRLRDYDGDDDRYGRALTAMVMRPADIGQLYGSARRSSQQAGMKLHVRLNVNAPARYHAVRWETLRDPETGHRIATDSDVLFSRYLSSGDWRHIPTRPKHDLRGLIVVSAPTDLAGGALADIDGTAERARAQAALAGFPHVEELERAELSAILAALAADKKGIDVLYVVCHGRLGDDDVPQLLLENEDGTSRWVDGRTLVDRLTELERRPTIAMLCSCQSAGRADGSWSADGGALVGLGPRLAAAGAAAVIAMQGDFSLASAEVFGPEFFSELRSHGQVDRAMASARRAIGDRPDWWVPVLFSRLRSGRTYHRPEFADDASITWAALEDALSNRRLTLVLGPGLANAILSSRQELAARWVERWQLPIAVHSRSDLAQVAQFLRVRFEEDTVRDQLLRHLRDEISARIEAAGPDDPFWNLRFDVERPSDALLAAGKRLRERNPDDPYKIAASLPVSVYVTTGWTNLLEDALEEKGRKPETMMFRWNHALDPPNKDAEFQPTLKRPLVYHLFGHVEEQESLVLSEDDYFDWFRAWVQRAAAKVIPSPVQEALTNRSLVFLGFQLDEWDFRVVFNAVKSFQGSSRLDRRKHAGVQLSPETPLIEPDAAQEYLESYLGKTNVKIYWGEAADFLREFKNQARAIIDEAWVER